VPYQFPGDPDRISKLFVVALNVEKVQALRCFKPTSKPQHYEDDPDRLAGVVVYRRGEVECFESERTFIEPKHYPMSYSELQRYDARGEFSIVGRLPAEFRERMIAAVNAKIEWRNTQKQEFLRWFR